MRKNARLTTFSLIAILAPGIAAADSSFVQEVDYIADAASVEYVMVEPVFVDDAATTNAQDGGLYPVVQDATVMVDDSYTVEYQSFEAAPIDSNEQAAAGMTAMTEVIDGIVYETILGADTAIIEGNAALQTY